MEEQLVGQIRKAIKESHLTEETKTQLLSLMDFIKYPEVKERILKILEFQDKITDLEIKYLQEMDKRFRNSDVFGYKKESMSIPPQKTNNQQQNVQQNINIPVQQSQQPIYQQNTNPPVQPNINTV